MDDVGDVVVYIPDHGEIPCFVCGVPATRYESFLPVCDCVTCYTYRHDHVLEEVKKMYSKMIYGGDI